jgi:tRNA(adenine34) deaminase
MLDIFTDDYFMKEALKEAYRAKEEGEVPVGAVVVAGKQVIARAHNQTEVLGDVTAHAEMLAITAAANALGSKYLEDCTVYVTLEPCPMCAGALAWARPSRVVYGASDDKRGFMKYGKELIHGKTVLEYGVMHDACVQLLQEFFKDKRYENAQLK